jgi:hypothetical protein
MGKKSIIFFTFFVTLLFAFACSYTLFDKMREADSFFGKKYEARDTRDLYAGKRSNLDDVLVSVTLFPPFRDTFFEFLPSYFSSNAHLVMTFSVLRC